MTQPASTAWVYPVDCTEIKVIKKSQDARVPYRHHCARKMKPILSRSAFYDGRKGVDHGEILSPPIPAG